MVNSYLRRIERVESTLAPKQQFLVLVVAAGEANETALATYATAHGIKPADVLCPVVYLAGADALL